MHKSDINARSNKRWNILFNAVKQYEGGERLREKMTGKMNLKAIETWKKIYNDKNEQPKKLHNWNANY